MRSVLSSVYSIINIQMGSKQSAKFLVNIDKDSVDTMSEREQMKYINEYFTRVLMESGKVDEVEIYRLTEVSIDTIDRERWLYKISYLTLPTMLERGIEF